MRRDINSLGMQNQPDLVVHEGTTKPFTSTFFLLFFVIVILFFVIVSTHVAIRDAKLSTDKRNFLHKNPDFTPDWSGWETVFRFESGNLTFQNSNFSWMSLNLGPENIPPSSPPPALLTNRTAHRTSKILEHWPLISVLKHIYPYLFNVFILNTNIKLEI